jgi:hypothetical protein
MRVVRASVTQLRGSESWRSILVAAVVKAEGGTPEVTLPADLGAPLALLNNRSPNNLRNLERGGSLHNPHRKLRNSLERGDSLRRLRRKLRNSLERGDSLRRLRRNSREPGGNLSPRSPNRQGRSGKHLPSKPRGDSRQDRRSAKPSTSSDKRPTPRWGDLHRPILGFLRRSCRGSSRGSACCY